MYILRSFLENGVEGWLSSEKIYLRRTLRAKSAKVELSFCAGSGLWGMNLCPRPRSCLVPVGGE